MVNDRPVVSVIRAWSGALTWTTRRLAGHTAVLADGAGGSLIISQADVWSAGGRLIIVVRIVCVP